MNIAEHLNMLIWLSRQMVILNMNDHYDIRINMKVNLLIYKKDWNRICEIEFICYKMVRCILDTCRYIFDLN